MDRRSLKEEKKKKRGHLPVTRMSRPRRPVEREEEVISVFERQQAPIIGNMIPGAFDPRHLLPQLPPHKIPSTLLQAENMGMNLGYIAWVVRGG